MFCLNLYSGEDINAGDSVFHVVGGHSREIGTHLVPGHIIAEADSGDTIFFSFEVIEKPLLYRTPLEKLKPTYRVTSRYKAIAAARSAQRTLFETYRPRVFQPTWESRC